ncbi:hypothetical protein Tco_0378929 [Tanacetum coccineum]
MPEVSTANIPTDSTAPHTPTTVFENEDIFLDDALVMLSDKTKLKGVEIKEIKDTDRPARSVLTLKPLPTIDPKNKGKGILEEEPKPVNVKSKAQRKLLAEQRAVAIRNKPLTKNQLRNQMITFLKHVGRYTHNKLRNKKFDEVKVLYEKAKKSVQDFIPIGSTKDERLIEKMNTKEAGEDTSKKEKVLEEPDSTKMEVKQEEVEESTRKRPGTILKMTARKKARKQTHVDGDASKKRKGSLRMKRMSKRKKTDSDLEEEEHLKNFLKIVPDEEGIGINYRIFRSDGSSRWIKTFSETVTRFDRIDLMELYNLVMQRFETTTLEGVDLVLWGDLRTVFDTNTEDELWHNQERWNLKNWDFYENCGVHTLILEYGTEMNMLAERKYPLTKETLEKMMSLKLVAESASDGAYNLLRSIQKQIDESGSYDGICQKLYGSQLTMLHSKELASPKQTALGKDFSNPLMVDSLPKTIWLSMHHVIAMKHWLFQSKRLLLLRCCKDDKDWKLMNVKYYKVTKELKFIKEHIKE